ncbi:hypothetical protein NDU88_002759 [Pleurodeles waltl]|uniref:Uncharacterized protein n=1 Tax=Pleurodeles waltl TaxID=8319 RepID=A0AAV7WME6_PLEWA|nr:hypothetical protein NDU88_002759 [Pleurodeles waltl]
MSVRMRPLGGDREIRFVAFFAMQHSGVGGTRDTAADPEAQRPRGLRDYPQPVPAPLFLRAPRITTVGRQSVVRHYTGD